MRLAILLIATFIALIALIHTAGAQTRQSILNQPAGFFIFHEEEIADEFGYQTLEEAKEAATIHLADSTKEGVTEKVVIIAAVPVEVMGN